MTIKAIREEVSSICGVCVCAHACTYNVLCAYILCGAHVLVIVVSCIRVEQRSTFLMEQLLRGQL